MRRLSLAIVLTAALVGSSSPAVAARRAAIPAAIVLSGPLSLASTTSAGVKGSRLSQSPSLSASGTVVAFGSLAPNLAPGDTDTISDLFLKDLTTGGITLASTSDDGVKGNGDSFGPTVDGDGSAVAFLSTATNLDPGDTDAEDDIYVKDLTTGDLVLASTADDGTKGDGISFFPSLARTGITVAFASEATNLDPGDTEPVRDVYVKDVASGDVVLASTTMAGVKGNGESTSPSISSSGGRVAFGSGATNFNPADTDGASDIYVKILGTGRLLLASRSDAGVESNGFDLTPSLAGAGRKVAFTSTATNLDPADTDSVQDIFVKNVSNADIVLASTSAAGVKGNGTSASPELSRNGTRVVFVSMATNLDPSDTSSDWDVYVKDLVSGDIQLASTTAAGVKGTQTTQERVTISGAGKLTAFDSNATNLDPADTDAGTDIYVKDSTACTQVGTAGDDTLAGAGGQDVICGEGGNDTIDARGGIDTVFGGSGNDLIQGGPGSDTLNGGDGSDTLDYATSGNSVVVNLAAHTATGGDAAGDAYVNVEGVQGSAHADSLTGDAGDNDLVGLGDDDVLTGAGGGDLLQGGGGIDILDYQASPAAVAVDLATETALGGDAEGDAIDGFEGALGSAFDDTLTGDGGDNFFLGMGGADAIDGAGGTDLANYAFSPEAVTVNLSNGNTNGGDADGDVLTRIENVAGSAFGDTLIGTDDANSLFGSDGGDDLTGKDGDDFLFGQAGTDIFDGGGDTDTCDDVAGETAVKCEL